MSANSALTVFNLQDQSARSGDTQLWTVTLDVPGEKVNILNRKVIDEFGLLIDRLESLHQEGKIDALVVFSGKPGNFIAGADITLFQSAQTATEAENLSRLGQSLFNRWEDLPFPTVVAINGSTLGGGCEFSLASRAILMSDDPAARIGLPEVMLGVLPGTGGCVRLPQKVGLATALDMILTGKNLNGERAYKAGLAEACIPRQNFEESAIRWVRTNISALKAGKRLAKEPKLGGMGGMAGKLMEKTPVGRNVIFSKARQGVLSKTKGHYPAPLEALDVIESTGVGYGHKLRGKARDKALLREAQGFGKLAATPVSKNLIRIFFLTESVKKSKGLPQESTAQPVPVRTAGVLGAGVMGGGIAQLFAEKNIPTRMKDINTQALALGMQSAAAIFKKQVQRKKINKRQYLQKMNLIAPVLDFSGFRAAGAVVEAVIEKMDVKKKVFQELEDQVGEKCVIATNTSSLSVSEMQSVLKRPDRFVGMHFFNPVHKMPLVEVIRGEKSSDEAVATIFQFSKQLGKTPIVVKDAPGFLVNRLLMPYLSEATYLLAEGSPIQELDRVLLNFGMPMGPMELIDEVGIDVAEKVAHILNNAFGPRMEPSPLNEKLVSAGYLGKKNGKGFYLYDVKDRKKEFDAKIYEVLGVKPSPGTAGDEEILDRCILPMINEAARCLDEGVVATASDVDLGMIMGTGFPPFRGGLLRYADSLGVRQIVERLRKYESRFGARYAPAEALLKRAENDQPFHAS